MKKLLRLKVKKTILHSIVWNGGTEKYGVKIGTNKVMWFCQSRRCDPTIDIIFEENTNKK